MTTLNNQKKTDKPQMLNCLVGKGFTMKLGVFMSQVCLDKQVTNDAFMVEESPYIIFIIKQFSYLC